MQDGGGVGPRPLGPGIPDRFFLRAEKIPLTKAPVRAQLMAMLRPKENAVCWDVGCGTGGVTAELAEACPLGTVYAVDDNGEACTMTRANAARNGHLNVHVIEGKAPEALFMLPAPDCVFIGGSQGAADEIVSLALQKNPSAVIGITAVTMETAAVITALFKRYEAEGFLTECVQISASVGSKAGRYHLFKAENPVWIAVLKR